MNYCCLLSMGTSGSHHQITRLSLATFKFMTFEELDALLAPMAKKKDLSIIIPTVVNFWSIDYSDQSDIVIKRNPVDNRFRSLEELRHAVRKCQNHSRAELQSLKFGLTQRDYLYLTSV